MLCSALETVYDFQNSFDRNSLTHNQNNKNKNSNGHTNSNNKVLESDWNRKVDLLYKEKHYIKQYVGRQYAYKESTIKFRIYIYLMWPDVFLVAEFFVT